MNTICNMKYSLSVGEMITKFIMFLINWFVIVFYSVLFVYFCGVFSLKLPNKLDFLVEIFMLRVLSICPQCLQFFSVCSTWRSIAIFGRSVVSPGSAQWKSRDVPQLHFPQPQQRQWWCHLAPYLELSPVQQPLPFCSQQRN